MIFRLVMHGVSTPSSPDCRMRKRARTDLCRMGQRWSSLPRQLSRNGLRGDQRDVLEADFGTMSSESG